MRNAMYAIFALVVAGALASTGLVVASVHHNGATANNGKGIDAPSDEQNENEIVMMNVSAGGGWFMVQNSTGAMFKDTFGLFLNANGGKFNNSSFVFQARDVHMTIHAVEFDWIRLDNTTAPGHWTAKAMGKAVGGGLLWSFFLRVTDEGKGSVDNFDLMVENGTQMLMWATNGLGGGNITVMPFGAEDVETGELEDQEEQGDQDEQDWISSV